MNWPCWRILLLVSQKWWVYWHQAASHYLSQWWPIFIIYWMSYDITCQDHSGLNSHYCHVINHDMTWCYQGPPHQLPQNDYGHNQYLRLSHWSVLNLSKIAGLGTWLGKVIIWLTPLVLKPEYSRKTMTLPWLLMPWLLVSPGHQLPCYWLSDMNRSVSPMQKYLNEVC